MIFRALLIGGTTLLLAGCASQPGSCDARDASASLIAKMQCDHSGGYSEQVREREQALIQARVENAAFHQVYDDLVAQQQATGKNLAEQQQRQAALDASLNKLLTQLRTRHADKANVLQQIGELEKQMASARKAVTTADPAAVEARKQELKALQQKVARLQLSLGYE
ncbi:MULTISPECIES: hypothetical protein [Pseudomonas]|uniref:Lipoprotein n=1 Tax=Pseudomonas citronellolis TaxID=53408 RepID=A0A1A9KFJ0_9PSED|nr:MULTISPECIES: hypothetical protein [Pseudomonas]ANI16302.1 hypothetical protein A9C11_21035 [Pseudomonas citronellolis]EJU9614656.1 hypothetical protein [Pseudomonas aeruginosa]EKU2928213.1 hypothetical protein [Pseudomonas aeruginosa]ELM0223526.1 hypothetical protein [Pseudomonas aeruginosa]KSE81071.1 hypothetical protein AO924_20180 [Pseudomonas aeruginosa]